MISYVTWPDFQLDAVLTHDAMLDKDRWYHVAGSYDFHDKTLNIFVDGELKSTERYESY